MRTEPYQFGVWTRIVNQLRHGLVLHTVLRYLQHIGLGLKPYVLYREECSQRSNDVTGGYCLQDITPANVERVIESFPERYFAPGHFRQRVASGDLGVLLTYGDEMVAYSWVNLRHCIFQEILFELKPTEAHIMDTYVVRAHRGRRLAPMMRRVIIDRLCRMGRVSIFSATELFNTSARNFKKAMGATPLEVRISMTLSSRWRADCRLRSYGPSLPTRRWTI